MKSEGTKKALTQGYYAKNGVKRSVTGRATVINGQTKTAVNL